MTWTDSRNASFRLTARDLNATDAASVEPITMSNDIDAFLARFGINASQGDALLPDTGAALLGDSPAPGLNPAGGDPGAGDPAAGHPASQTDAVPPPPVPAPPLQQEVVDEAAEDADGAGQNEEQGEHQTDEAPDDWETDEDADADAPTESDFLTQPASDTALKSADVWYSVTKPHAGSGGGSGSSSTSFSFGTGPGSGGAAAFGGGIGGGLFGAVAGGVLQMMRKTPVRDDASDDWSDDGGSTFVPYIISDSIRNPVPGYGPRHTDGSGDDADGGNPDGSGQASPPGQGHPPALDTNGLTPDVLARLAAVEVANVTGMEAMDQFVAARAAERLASQAITEWDAALRRGEISVEAAEKIFRQMDSVRVDAMAEMGRAQHVMDEVGAELARMLQASGIRASAVAGPDGIDSGADDPVFDAILKVLGGHGTAQPGTEPNHLLDAFERIHHAQNVIALQSAKMEEAQKVLTGLQENAVELLRRIERAEYTIAHQQIAIDTGAIDSEHAGPVLDAAQREIAVARTIIADDRSSMDIYHGFITTAQTAIAEAQAIIARARADTGLDHPAQVDDDPEDAAGADPGSGPDDSADHGTASHTTTTSGPMTFNAVTRDAGGTAHDLPSLRAVVDVWPPQVSSQDQPSSEAGDAGTELVVIGSFTNASLNLPL